MPYDAIVIGGGLSGLSIAWRLRERGRRVLLLERAILGAGTSSKGVGGFRQQWSTPINIALSQLSLPIFEQLGARIRFEQHGYLMLATEPATLAQLQARATLQQRYGVPLELLDPDQIRVRFPFLRSDDLCGAVFCGADGYLDPRRLLATYAAEARAAGVEIAERTPVTGVQRKGERVVGVELSNGTAEAPVVIDAAGPWAARVAALAGLDVPVVPLKRQVWPTTPTEAAPPSAPLTIDAATGWHFRPRDGALLFAMAGGEQPGAESLDLDPLLAERMLANGRFRLPRFDGQLAEGWAGLYEVTPDAHAILGESDELAGFFFACGFSGHGLMHSPATGTLLAALICGEQPAIDIRPLHPGRFAAGRLLGEGAVY